MQASSPPRPRVLVVDDDEANLRAFERVFRKSYDIAVASSGAAALEVLEGRVFDVALVDYSMPDMSGIDLLRRVETTHPKMTRVMLTAHADLPEVVATTRNGLTLAAVMKPWERADIERVVGRAMSFAAMSQAVDRMTSKAAARS